MWRKSTFSSAAECVEIAFAPDRVMVRDSKHPTDSELTFTVAEWRAFLLGVHDGQFELEQQ